MENDIKDNNNRKVVSKTFVKVTNEDIYKLVQEIHEQTKLTNGRLKWHQKWLIGLTSAFSGALLFILTILFRGG